MVGIQPSFGQQQMQIRFSQNTESHAPIVHIGGQTMTTSQLLKHALSNNQQGSTLNLLA